MGIIPVAAPTVSTSVGSPDTDKLHQTSGLETDRNWDNSHTQPVSYSSYHKKDTLAQEVVTSSLFRDIRSRNHRSTHNCQSACDTQDMFS
jgi:hypothetical protein